MTSQECDLIRHAIETLRRLLPDDEPLRDVPAQRCYTVARFVQEYLAPDPDADIACEEAWQFFQEVVQAGELPPMRKAVFLRQLPIVMESIYDVRKCHSIERGGRRVRGFRGVGVRVDDLPPAQE